MIKLHLGCGTKHLPEYVNIDIRYLPGVDEVNNIRFLRNYKNNTVDEIYACHVLEHFGRWEYKSVLQRWYEILKPGGQLRLAVPNFESICQHYRKTSDLKSIMGLLYGGQDYDENYHYVTFDLQSLSEDLSNIGFSKIELWDCEKYEGDDFSKAYLPHMDKENGILMSLNILATK
jgi:predicted SAM-dependent methyltransferase